jgi:alkanesulfonate monooxygenase SsuD/methylene tetrahydromethanopterin reductase-like flavin-dependent oxidoreductase (luciferase family)
LNFGFLTECYVREGKPQALAFADTFAQVDAAEALGMDSVWMVEQHFRPWASILASPMVMAGAIAARTKRIRIGLAVQVLPLGNPLRMAEEAATVDHISQGRFDFGVGRSGITKFYEGYNIPFSESRGRFREALDVILKAFTEETFSYEGKHWSFHDVTMTPKPLQQPYPPIYVATSTPENFPEMGKRGFPILIWFMGNYFDEPMKLYRQAWREAGHPGEPQVLMRIPAYVGETPERARSEAKESTLHDLRRAFRENSHAMNQEQVARAQQLLDNYPEVLKTRVAYGSPEEMVERLQGFKERMGLSGFLLDLNYGGQIPQELVLHSMRLLTEKVMPKFK